MEDNIDNPYAPPKVNLSEDHDIYFAAEGFVSGNSLVTNEYFRPPLICAKLGIPLNDNTTHTPKLITIKRNSVLSPAFHSLLIASLLMLVISCIYPSRDLFLAFVLMIMTFCLNRLITTKYEIPFYFSKHYLKNRKRKVILFCFSYVLFLFLFLYSSFSRDHDILMISLSGFWLTAIIYYFSMNFFSLRKKTGESYFIKGVHPNLLANLPILSSRTEKICPDNPNT